MSGIKAKAKFSRGSLQSVRATLLVEVPVEVEIQEDGTFELLKTVGEEERVIQVSADRVESTIYESYEEEELAEAYEKAVQLHLDPEDDETANELDL